MTAKELAERILAEIERGELNPDAIVIRPFCLCDHDVGYVEARFLDQVVRRFQDNRHGPSDGETTRLYRYGNVEPGHDSALTLKLG